VAGVFPQRSVGLEVESLSLSQALPTAEIGLKVLPTAEIGL